jgi:hypothetical protein
MTRLEKKSANHADCSTIFGWSMQKHGYSPASLKVCSNVAAAANMQESNLPSRVAFSPDVAVCGCESSFVHVIV